MDIRNGRDLGHKNCIDGSSNDMNIVLLFIDLHSTEFRYLYTSPI